VIRLFNAYLPHPYCHSGHFRTLTGDFAGEYDVSAERFRLLAIRIRNAQHAVQNLDKNKLIGMILNEARILQRKYYNYYDLPKPPQRGPDLP